MISFSYLTERYSSLNEDPDIAVIVNKIWKIQPALDLLSFIIYVLKVLSIFSSFIYFIKMLTMVFGIYRDIMRPSLEISPEIEMKPHDNKVKLKNISINHNVKKLCLLYSKNFWIS